MKHRIFNISLLSAISIVQTIGMEGLDRHTKGSGAAGSQVQQERKQDLRSSAFEQEDESSVDVERRRQLKLGHVASADDIAIGIQLGNEATLAEIAEYKTLFAAGYRASYEQVNASIYLRIANGSVPLNPTLLELDECVRFMNDAHDQSTVSLINYNSVQDSLRLKNSGGVDGPFAPGLTIDQFVEATRLRLLPGNAGAPGPFAAGVTPSQLLEAMRLKAIPQYADGAPAALILPH